MFLEETGLCLLSIVFMLLSRPELWPSKTPHRQHVRPSPWQRHLGWQNCWARSRVQAHRVGDSRGMAVSPVLLPFFRLLSTLVLGSRHCNLIKWCTVDLIACCYRCLLVLAYSVWGLGAQARWQEGEFYLYLFATAVEWNTGLDFRARYHRQGKRYCCLE